MKKSFSKFFGAVVAAILLSSCATTVSSRVIRPAELNLDGAKTISVLPFDITDSFSIGHSFFGFFAFTHRNQEESELADYIQRSISDKLMDAGYFQVISGKQVERALEAGQTPPCDVYIAGALTGFGIDVECIETDKFDKRGNPIYEYRKVVHFRMTYEVINAKTGAVYYSYHQNFSGSDSDSEAYYLDSATEILSSSISLCTTDLMKKLQPYEYTLSLKLLDYDDNDKMEAAKEIAKKKQYIAAQKSYESIYNETGLFEAGYNCAILLEILGEYEQARLYLENLYCQTFDTRAAKAIEGIDREIMYRNRLGEQEAARQDSL